MYNAWDRGLLGMAIDPNFPSQPYVYVFYTFDSEELNLKINPKNGGVQ